MRSQNCAAHVALAAAVVYRCTVQDVTVFSDRPCAPDAATYQADTSRVSTYTPPPISSQAKPSAPPRVERKRGRDSAAQDQRHEKLCERVRTGLKEVAAKMRAGYSAKQGEQLRERKARLEQQRRAEHCR
jgi:hypothetical protein